MGEQEDNGDTRQGAAVKGKSSDVALDNEIDMAVGDVEESSSTQASKSDLKWRPLIFAVFTVALGIAFGHSLIALARLSMTDETYSHMPLIPLVSAYLLFDRRKRIFSQVETAILPGLLTTGLGLFLWIVAHRYPETASLKDDLSQNTLAVLITWYGGFLLVFGRRSFREAVFPLLFLLFIVPIPMFLLNGIVQFLRQASTEVASALFTVSGVPVLRDGFLFELPGMSVMVADECCGIRSSISLLITGVLAAHFALTSPWRRAVLMLAVLPITIFKNSLRIITLTLLGAYVDERILHSVIHRMGGIPFFVLALLLFGCVLWVLRRSEAKAPQ